MLRNRMGVMKKPVSQLIARLWAVQFALVVFSSAYCYKLDIIIAYSFVLGALNFWLPNAFFALSVFRYKGEEAAQLMLQSVYRGQMNKFVLTAVGFAVIFSVVKSIHVAALFAGYGMMSISQLIIVSRWE